MNIAATLNARPVAYTRRRRRRRNGKPSGEISLKDASFVDAWLYGPEPSLPAWTDYGANALNLAQGGAPAVLGVGSRKWAAGASFVAGDSLTTPDNAALRFSRSQPFTMCAWVYTGTAAGQNVVSKTLTGTLFEYRLMINGGIVSWSLAENAGTLYNYTVSAPAIPANTWTLLVFGWDAGNDRAFLQVGAGPAYRSPGRFVGSAFGVGPFYIGTNYTGRIEQVARWDKLLNTAERIALNGKSLLDFGAMINAAGGEAYTGIASEAVAPSAPTNAAASLNGSGQPVITWQVNASTVTAHRVYRSVNGGGYVAMGSVANNGDTFTDTTAVNFSNLNAYRVRAVNFSGESGDSNTATAPPPAPTLTSFTQAGANVNAAWTSDGASTSWQSQTNVNGAGWFNYNIYVTNSASFAHGLLPGDDIQFRVAAIRSGAQGAFSNSIQINIV